MVELRVARAGDDGPPQTKQPCPGCGAIITAAGGELAGCAGCNVVSVGAQCGCTALARFGWTGQAAGPARWLRLSVGRSAPVYVCSASCAMVAIDALVSTGTVAQGPG
jgi:hypothetical protein